MNAVMCVAVEGDSNSVCTSNKEAREIGVELLIETYASLEMIENMDTNMINPSSVIYSFNGDLMKSV